MKVCVIQPPYSTEFADSQDRFSWELAALEGCGKDLDMIVPIELRPHSGGTGRD